MKCFRAWHALAGGPALTPAPVSVLGRLPQASPDQQAPLRTSLYMIKTWANLSRAHDTCLPRRHTELHLEPLLPAATSSSETHSQGAACPQNTPSQSEWVTQPHGRNKQVLPLPTNLPSQQWSWNRHTWNSCQASDFRKGPAASAGQGSRRYPWNTTKQPIQPAPQSIAGPQHLALCRTEQSLSWTSKSGLWCSLLTVSKALVDNSSSL